MKGSRGCRVIATEGMIGERRRRRRGADREYNSICELLVRRHRRTPSHAWCLNKLYTCNLTQILGSKWGLTRGRKGKEVEKGKVEDKAEVEAERGGGRRSGGFFGSRQTKYNSASYKEGSQGDEGSLTLLLSLSRSHSILRSRFTLRSPSRSRRRRRRVYPLEAWMDYEEPCSFIRSLAA